VVSFRPRLLYPRYPLYKRLYGSQVWSGYGGEQKNFLSFREWSPGCQNRSSVTILTELPPLGRQMLSRPEFNPREVHVAFLVCKVTMGKVFLQVFWLVPATAPCSSLTVPKMCDRRDQPEPYYNLGWGWGFSSDQTLGDEMFLGKFKKIVFDLSCPSTSNSTQTTQKILMKHGMVELPLLRHFHFGLVLFILRATLVGGLHELLCVFFESTDRFWWEPIYGTSVIQVFILRPTVLYISIYLATW